MGAPTMRILTVLKQLKVLNIDGNGIVGPALEKLKSQLPGTKIIYDNPF
jgi:hypothetical protein